VPKRNRKQRRKEHGFARRRKGGYDVAMIRDFLDHLAWELRIGHFENTTAPGTINPELAEQLAKYIRKYHCGLLIGDVTSESRDSEGFAKLRATRAQEREQQLNALESLTSLFDEALLCASKTGSLVFRQVDRGLTHAVEDTRYNPDDLAQWAGVADCRGVELFDWIPRAKPVEFYLLRAAVNPHRRAVAYLTSMRKKDGLLVEELVDQGEYDRAFHVVQSRAKSIKVQDSESNQRWHMLPDPSINMLTVEELIASIDSGKPLHRLLLAEMADGKQLIIDGQLRRAAIEIQGLGEVAADVVKLSEMPNRLERLGFEIQNTID
jgi:hypothetical protein